MSAVKVNFVLQTRCTSNNRFDVPNTFIFREADLNGCLSTLLIANVNTNVLSVHS